jgi:hypothetical protein
MKLLVAVTKWGLSPILNPIEITSAEAEEDLTGRSVEIYLEEDIETFGCQAEEVFSDFKTPDTQGLYLVEVHRVSLHSPDGTEEGWEWVVDKIEYLAPFNEVIGMIKDFRIKYPYIANEWKANVTKRKEL